MQSSRGTRLAFLKEGLATAANASVIRLREHPLMVALSQVDREEAAHLFHEALLPAIRSSREPDVLWAAFTLMRRWNVPQAGSLTEELAGRIAEEQDTNLIGPLANGATALATDTSDPAVGRLAATLIDRLLVEPDWRIRRTLAGALEQLPAAPPIAPALANALVGRLVQERDVPTAEVWLTAVQALAPGFDPSVKPELAGTLARRVANAPQEMLPVLTAGLGALGDAVSVEQANLAASVMAEKIRGAAAPAAASVLAAGLGVISGRAGSAAFELAADSLVARMETTRDPYPLSVLGSGLHAVAGPLRPQVAAGLASRLSVRVAAASDPAVLVRLLLALHAVAHGWSPEEAARFASQMKARMQTANGAATRRILAFGLHAVDPQAASEFLAETLAAAPGDESCPAGGDAKAVARQLLNPLCSEENWLRLAVALADLTGEPVARAAASDGERSLEELAGVDDDDGAAASAGGEIEVDFNKLSDVLRGLRPPSEEAGTRPPALSIALLLAGAALLIASRYGRGSGTAPPRPSALR